MEPHNHPEYERTFERVANILEAFAGTLTKLGGDLIELRELTQRTSESLDRYIAEARERDAETTDKLNALIDLMDRHIHEPHPPRNP